MKPVKVETVITSENTVNPYTSRADVGRTPEEVMRSRGNNYKKTGSTESAAMELQDALMPGIGSYIAGPEADGTPIIPISGLSSSKRS